MDWCIYWKINGGNICYFVLYVGYILIIRVCCTMWNDLSLKKFDAKDIGETCYDIDIKIYKDGCKYVLVNLYQ